MTLSAVISAHNEQDKIKDCFESIKWVDEIILVDNQSSDKTVHIAKKYTSKIFSHKNNPLKLNESKNFGFSKAKGNWLLSLDPDERISPELEKEIASVLKNTDAEIDGFLIPRKNIIFGKWIQHGLWYPDYQLRLFRRDKGKFPAVHNHELLKVKGETRKLKNHIIHLNYTSVNQYLKKITYYYSDNEAEQFIKSGKIIKWHDAIRMPISDFLTNFFARRGYKDGLHGLVLALLQSFYTLIVFAKIWEKQGFWEYNNEDFQNEAREEFSLKGKELAYWFQIAREENSGKLERLILKIKRGFFS